MGDREYRSIGETLELIKEEFPEVTISKIRFLETQGLIAPERTTNGYRKFYEHDIERLAFVLRQQREQFLPLKVIKDRITEKEPGVFILDPNKGRFARDQKAKSSKFERDIFGDPVMDPVPSRQYERSNHKVDGKDGALQGASGGRPSVGRRVNNAAASATRANSVGAKPSSGYSENGSAGAHDSATKSANSGVETQKLSSNQNGEDNGTPSGARRPRLFALPTNSSLAEHLDEARAFGDLSTNVLEGDDQESDVGEAGFPKNSFTARDIAEQADLSLVQVQDLTTYGLLNPTNVRSQQVYSAADLALAVLAKEFARFGLEARHLKMYKVSAEREASFLEQVILPILANKTQKSRNRAEAALTQLGEFGAQFRTLLLERAIEKILKS